ncbi:hypothetical protein A2U01_0001241 [Trifolium medium]|uniref:Uncharacterized protein n=1 Tax=Trifolium medium TaxID=97028 RepID=A0A392LZK6_9FABA|nr:hypothetical protein [Trifolium medium]
MRVFSVTLPVHHVGWTQGPEPRVTIYKFCWEGGGCFASDYLAATDPTIIDKIIRSKTTFTFPANLVDSNSGPSVHPTCCIDSVIEKTRISHRISYHYARCGGSMTISVSWQPRFLDFPFHVQGMRPYLISSKLLLLGQSLVILPDDDAWYMAGILLSPRNSGIRDVKS